MGGRGRLVGGAVGAFAGAHVTICLLVVFASVRALGIAQVALLTAAIGFVLGFRILGPRLDLVMREPRGRRAGAPRPARIRVRA
jgi:hypothetical protein